jgi:putative addiction module killer protein
VAVIETYVTVAGKDIVEAWLRSIKDATTRSRIVRRIDRLAKNNPGDWKSLGGGLMELRIPVGPGFRVYFWKNGDEYVLLLCGGDKGSQSSDIAKAREYLKDHLERTSEDANQN